MERDNFDTELFIEEVEKRVPLWDMESSDYFKRNLKRRGWEELVEIFSEAGDSDEKKKALGISLQKKWKGLRDSFVRELKKINNAPSGSGASNKNSYIYFNRLMFLERSVRNKITDGNINATPDVSTAATRNETTAAQDLFSGNGEDVMRPPRVLPTKKRNLNSADAEFLSVIKSTISSENKRHHSSITECDDDKLFCLSLHKELLKIPEVNRLQIKIELMNVLQKGQQIIQNTLTTARTTSPVFQYSTRYPQPHQPTVPYQSSFSNRSFTRMTQREQEDYFSDNPQYDLAIPSSSSFSNRGGFDPSAPSTSSSLAYGYTTRNTKHTTYNPTTPSPVSTIDSQESECLDLFQDEMN